MGGQGYPTPGSGSGLLRATQAMVGHGAMIWMTVRCRPSLASQSSPWPNQLEVSLRLPLGLVLKILLALSISGLTSSQMTTHQGQCFVGHHDGGQMEETCSHHGISHYPMGLTGRGQMCSGRLLVQLLSRTPCYFSLTVWTGPEELGSVALLMSTEGDITSERASQYSFLCDNCHREYEVPIICIWCVSHG